MSLYPLAPWFLEKARKLPWRLPRYETDSKQSPDPWAVLVSEVMLQQTQVATVLPYFNRWMQAFPTPAALAEADEAQVMKLWEGLGYYRRARGLQKAAKFLVARGSWPQTREELLQIPGVGPYTSAALLAFAFHKKSLPVDGNVLRVASRWLANEADISKASTARLFEEELSRHLPEQKPWVIAEALIELGATICKPKEPACNQCPLQSSCKARQIGLEKQLPIKTRKASCETLYRSVGVIASKKDEATYWLVCKKISEGVFHGLWHFPYIQRDTEAAAPDLETYRLSELLGLNLQLLKTLKKRKHTFTRYSAHLFPLYLKTQKPSHIAPNQDWDYQWLDINTLKNLTFCSGHRQIRDELGEGSI